MFPVGIYQPLLGFRDFYPDDQRELNYIFNILRETALTFGFEEYSSPILEPLELFAAKSGNEIVEQLFSFTDKGGRNVALRPEMTPSVARMVGERINSMRKPVKWFNIAENFRYERPQKGRLRSFFQFNADIFGESNYRADVEVILLLIMIMQNFNLNDFVVKISDRHLWTLFLSAIGVMDQDITKVLCVVDKIERMDSADTHSILQKACPYVNSLFDNIAEFKSIKSIEILVDFLGKKNLLGIEDISRRLDELSHFVRAISMASGAADHVSVDFGIVRGLAYYTGFVFECFDSTSVSRALAGGGRYDCLVEKLGYGDIPAVGMAIGDVTLRDILREKNLLPKLEKTLNCFLVFDTSSKDYAMELANELRRCGLSLEYSFRDLSLTKQLRLAAQSGTKFAVVCGENERTLGTVRVKNLISGVEMAVEEPKLKMILAE
jgi:histidyl-tRNA synthetase